jgi:hypothetical protein
MDWTKHGELRVMGRARTRGLSRVVTDGFWPWQ